MIPEKKEFKIKKGGNNFYQEEEIKGSEVMKQN